MNFSLSRNPLYAKEGDPAYIAHTRTSKLMTKAQVIERLGHSSTLTEADINAVISGLEKILVDYLVMGLRIDLGFITLSHSIRGGFDSDEDYYRKDRNWININAKLNTAFVKAVNQSAKPTRVKPLGKSPEPRKMTKLLGDLSTSDFHGGDLVRITGSKLSFDETDKQSGVFFQCADHSTVRVQEYARKTDGSIMMKIPESLKPGSAIVEVRNRSSNGTIVKGVLEAAVTIFGPVVKKKK